MSNTFDGVLREFPFIGIDRFNTTASVFLLTHSHADHLTGISNKSFTGLVYCSKETKRLLELDTRLKGCMNLIKEVPYNTRTRLETSPDASNAVYITLIEAYHCLGACMFLVEQLDASDSEQHTNTQDSNFSVGSVSRAVLCTGDLRAETWWCESIRLTPSLLPYLEGDKTLDCIYFDSTFAYRDEPYIEIPPNNQGIHTAISMLREYPRNDPEIEFEFSDTTLGFDQVWAFVLSYFGGSLSIKSEGLKNKLNLVARHDRVYGKILSRAIRKSTTSKKLPYFHAGPPSEKPPLLVKIKQCINFNIRDFTGICCPISLEHVPSTEELHLVHTTRMGNALYDFLGRQWILPAGGKELLPLEVKLLFSRHSSYDEMRTFLSMFKPMQVFPCFYSHRVWRNGFTMARVFGDICTQKEFSFDNMMMADHGRPTQEILERPVVTVNRWNIEDCDREQNYIENLIEMEGPLAKHSALGGPNLIKLRKVARVPFLKVDRSADDQAFIRKRNKGFCLQKVVEGRRNATYEKFIREQQMLYYKRHSLPQYRRDYQSPKYSREFNSALGGTSDYDTDSCGSSFDLLEGNREHLITLKSANENSFVQESRQGLFWKVHKLETKVRKLGQNSFVASSYQSFEESIRPSKVRKTEPKAVLYMLEGHIDPAKIDDLSMRLADAPHTWSKLLMRCMAL